MAPRRRWRPHAEATDAAASWEGDAPDLGEAPAGEAPDDREAEDDDQGWPLAMMFGAATAPVRSVAGPITRSVGRLAAEAMDSYRGSTGARVRRIRRMAREPLANLWEVHPEAHQASQRELGLRTVPLENVRGTAVEGPHQRGGDFLPFRQLRGADWQQRWQRIKTAIDELVPLPPVDLIKFGDDYWVMDGHNRVGAALYNGQDAVDANVVEMRLPGVAAERPRPMAAYLQGSLDLRASGEGRFTRTAIRPDIWEILPDARPGTFGVPEDAGWDRSTRDDAEQPPGEAGSTADAPASDHAPPPDEAPPGEASSAGGPTATEQESDFRRGEQRGGP